MSKRKINIVFLTHPEFTYHPSHSLGEAVVQWSGTRVCEPDSRTKVRVEIVRTQLFVSKCS